MYFIVNHRCYPKVTQLETLFYFLLSVKEECVAVGANRKQTLPPLARLLIRVVNWENHLHSNHVSPKDSWQNVGALTEHKLQLEGNEWSETMECGTGDRSASL